MFHILSAIISTKAWLFDKTGIASAIVLIFFALTLYLLTLSFQSKKDQADDFRASFIATLTVTGTLAVAFVEILSLFNSVSRIPLIALWIIFACLLFFLSKKISFNHKFSAAVQINLFKDRTDFQQRFSLTILLIFVLLTLIVAYFASPNNWDSMTYHLPRILHWIQNQNVNFYPTNNTRQLYLSPGAEYFSLNFYLLTGGDRLANIIQWFSYLGSIISVSLICRSLGGNKNCQTATAILMASLPVAILQSTSTQNDLTATFFILCSVYFILEIRKRITNLNIIIAGCALGLAVLVKASSIFFLAPFIIYFTIDLIRIHKKAIARPLILTFLIVFAINAPFLARNYQFYRSLTAPESKTLANATFGWKETSSNVVKNLAINSVIGTKWEVAEVEYLVRQFHALIRYSINSETTSYAGTNFALASLASQTNEDVAGNPLILFGFLICVVVAFFSWHKTKKDGVIFLILCSLSLILFSAVFRWQIWGTRLILPFFALATIPVSLILFNRKYFNSLCLLALSLVLLLLSNQFLMTNMTRPLIGPSGILVTKRYNQYFVYKPNLIYSYQSAVDKIGQCNKVGLQLGGDDFEYPLWVTIKNKNSQTVIDDVLVANGTEKTAPVNYGHECAIISTINFTPELIFNNHEFNQIWTAPDNSATLYMPTDN